jgi:peptidoglycan/LPS O-acetylase OafA/YrhL
MPSSICLARAPQSKSVNYPPDIDGLLALALSAVVINHFDKRALPSGYPVVDIFL